MFKVLTDTENLQKAADQQVAGAEIVLLIAIVSLGVALFVSQIAMPALIKQNPD